MARSARKVTFSPKDLTRIADAFIKGALLVMRLLSSGVLDRFAQLIRIRRQGGYCGFDIWLVLFFYFAMPDRKGIRAFWKKIRVHQEQLAALAGRKSLPSPSSLARALGGLEFNEVRLFSHHLLMDVAHTDALLKHPATQTYDATGQGWHIFDLDPTITTLRQRALPVHDDLPASQRRAAQSGAPGYSGRKRGDIQFCRTTVNHAGSGLWVHAHLSEGKACEDLQMGLDSIVLTCQQIEHPTSKTLVRMDGEWGTVPGMTACRERHLPFITLLRRPSLYENPEVLQALRKATFYQVPDSLSGPRRAAADLGVMTLTACKKTRRKDGEAFEPIQVRVVVAIFPTQKASRGRLLDGWQVEFFAVDAPPKAWPAPEAVTSYFGRSGQENRFAQEDREVSLDRILSYHLPGQEFASLVGLSVWNLRLVEGFLLDPPAPVRPVQSPREALVDERVPVLWPQDLKIVRLLNTLDWERLLGKREGWSWDERRGQLHCDDGRSLRLTTVRAMEHCPGKTKIIFRRPSGGCQQCSHRQGCLNSKDPNAPKHVELTIATAVAAPLRKRLLQVRGKAPSSHSPSLHTVTVDPGPQAVHDALFLPASARQAHDELFLSSTLRVLVCGPSPKPSHLKLVADDVADRQRRRKTWEQNFARYAIDKRATVTIEVSADDALKEWLNKPQTHQQRLRRPG